MREDNLQQQDSSKASIAKWKQHSAKLRAENSLPPLGRRGAAPWTSSCPKGSLPPVPRILDLLDIGFLLARHSHDGSASRDDIARGLWADISQGCNLKPFQEGRMGTLATSSLMYSYEHNVILSAADSMSVLGWPRSFGCASAPEATMRNLIGESVSVPVWTQLIFAYYQNPWAPWWPSDRHT